MKYLVFIFSLLFLFTSCETSVETQEDKDKENEQSYVEYFYPTDSLVSFIYVYQNRNKALDEKVSRIYRSESASDTVLVVEFYNSALKITEAYSHNVNSPFAIEDHMIVDGDGKKRKARLSANTFFPTSEEEQTQFISDFPSHLDSITMIYQSKRRIIENEKIINVLGKDVSAIVLEDSVKVIFANPYTQKSSAQSVVIMRTFAKGYGMVGWSANNKEIAYELDGIMSNKWWEEYAESPQVKQ